MPIRPYLDGARRWSRHQSLASRRDLNLTGSTWSGDDEVALNIAQGERGHLVRICGQDTTGIGSTQTRRHNDPADVAKIGFDAMMKGEGDVVSG
jgi:hypothetical protein